jgi:hypothetical protein
MLATTIKGVIEGSTFLPTCQTQLWGCSDRTRLPIGDSPSTHTSPCRLAGAFGQMRRVSLVRVIEQIAAARTIDCQRDPRR